MKRGIRLTQSELERLLAKKSAGFGDSRPVFCQKRTHQRRAGTIVRAIATAKPTVTPLPAGVELRFDGARLATMNDLLAMTVRERYRYRAAWHTLVRDAALEAYAGRPPIFHAVSLTLTRQGPRDIDSDAIVPKAPIDGLRYAGFIPDDTQDVVRRLSLNPARGAYAVVILLSAWEQEHN